MITTLFVLSFFCGLFGGALAMLGYVNWRNEACMRESAAPLVFSQPSQPAASMPPLTPLGPIQGIPPRPAGIVTRIEAAAMGVKLPPKPDGVIIKEITPP